MPWVILARVHFGVYSMIQIVKKCWFPIIQKIAFYLGSRLLCYGMTWLHVYGNEAFLRRGTRGWHCVSLMCYSLLTYKSGKQFSFHWETPCIDKTFKTFCLFDSILIFFCGFHGWKCPKPTFTSTPWIGLPENLQEKTIFNRKNRCFPIDIYWYLPLHQCTDPPIFHLQVPLRGCRAPSPYCWRYLEVAFQARHRLGLSRIPVKNLGKWWYV